MSDPQALLEELARLDIEVRSTGSTLRIDAPDDENVFTPELRQRILTAKPALLALLSRPPSQQFAITDIEAAAGLPVYSSSDSALPKGASSREAGLNALILSFSVRLLVAEWIKLAGDQPLAPDIVLAVTKDLVTALTEIERKAEK